MSSTPTDPTVTLYHIDRDTAWIEELQLIPLPLVGERVAPNDLTQLCRSRERRFFHRTRQATISGTFAPTIDEAIRESLTVIAKMQDRQVAAVEGVLGWQKRARTQAELAVKRSQEQPDALLAVKPS